MGFWASAQTSPKSLKSTLFEAEKKYRVIFTFDDTLVSNFVGLEEALPPDLETFKQQLKSIYALDCTVSNQTIILSKNSPEQNHHLCGYIKNDLFEGAMENTLVLYGKQFTYTDQEGYFSFQNIQKNDDQLQFSIPQMGSFTTPISSFESCEDYSIDTSEIQLGEVIVNYIAPPIQKSSSGGYAFNLSNFKTSPGSVNPDIFELLQLIPGINTPNEDHEIFVRGGTPDQNQLLWNSIRVFQSNHANGNLSSLNPYGISTIKLYVKGVPPAYGEHTSGLIILDGFKPNTTDQIFEGSIGVGLIDADMANSLYLGEKLELHLSARQSFNTVLTDRFKSIAFNKLIDNTIPYQAFSKQKINYSDYTFSTRWRMDPNAFVDAYAFYLDDELGYELTENALEYKDLLNTRNYGLGLRHIVNRSDWRRLYTISYSDFELLYDRQLFEYEYDPEDDEYETDYKDLTYRDNHIKEVFIKTQHTKIFDEKWSALWGADLIYRNVALKNEATRNDQIQLTDNQLTGFNYALFGAVKSSYFDKYTFEVGLRYNYYQPLQISRIEPRVNLTRSLSKSWLLNTTFEKKSQSIYKTNETIQNSSSISNNLWTAIGGDLYPLLRSSQFSVGATHKKDRFIFDLDFYKRSINGITTFNFGYVDPNDNDFHLGKAAIWGADLFMQKNWNPLTVWANYSFQDNQNAFDDLKSGIWFNSNFLVKNLFSTGFNYRFKNWSIDANYTHRSGVPYSEPTGASLVNGDYQLRYDKLNTSFLPNFERVDASLSKRIDLKGYKLDFKLALKNITNQRNVLDRIHLYDKSTAQIRVLDRYSMVPFFNFGLRLFY